MKPFKEKYIVYQRNISDQPFLSWCVEDNKGYETPMIFDSYLHAAKEIIDNLNSIVDAIEKGYMGEDALENELHSNYIAKCSLYDNGVFVVYNGDETILRGPFDQWRDL